MPSVVNNGPMPAPAPARDRGNCTVTYHILIAGGGIGGMTAAPAPVSGGTVDVYAWTVRTGTLTKLKPAPDSGRHTEGFE